MLEALKIASSLIFKQPVQVNKNQCQLKNGQKDENDLQK